MNVSELTASIPGARLVGEDRDVTDLVIDSRKVVPGCLFICLSGAKADGHDYAKQAIERGAVALAVEHEVEDAGVPQIVAEDTRAAWSYMAQAWYGFPARSLKLIGVTGTKGKTTTTTLIRHVLEYAGYKVGLIGTIANYVAGEEIPQHLTTPDPMELQELFRRMADAGCAYCVMEVSAHAAALRKVAGLTYEIMAFTNLSQDHLDDFGSMENYGRAKALMFRDGVARMAIVNGDDSFAKEAVRGRKGLMIVCGVEKPGDVRAERVKVTLSGVSYELHVGGLAQPVSMQLGGRFNVYNSLLAAAVCAFSGLSLRLVADALGSVAGVAGRLERVEVPRPYHVFVDYAHSPDSLENVLRAVRPETEGQIWAVFGCGGDRDRLKRPVMGRIAEKLADRVVITTDNPRTEIPEEIIHEIAGGLEEPDHAVLLPDRTQAIHYALEHAQAGDAVVIAGKGHETYQDVMGVRSHYDDREVVRAYFATVEPKEK